MKITSLSEIYEMNVSPAFTILALLLASMKRSSHSATSETSISFRPFTLESILAGVSSCRAYLRLTLTPCSDIFSKAGSEIARPSVRVRVRTIVLTSSELYGWVGIMRRRARRSGGTP